MLLKFSSLKFMFERIFLSLVPGNVPSESELNHFKTDNAQKTRTLENLEYTNTRKPRVHEL